MMDDATDFDRNEADSKQVATVADDGGLRWAIFSFRARARRYWMFSVLAQLFVIISILGGIYVFGYASQISARANKSELVAIEETISNLAKSQTDIQESIAREKENLAEAQAARDEVVYRGKRIGHPEKDENRLASYDKALEIKYNYRIEDVGARIEHLGRQLALAKRSETEARARQLEILEPGSNNIILVVTTKIGSVLLLLFFVRMLIVVFKYYTRLSVFYQSRADLLEYFGFGSAAFAVEVSNLITPGSIDFENSSLVDGKELMDSVARLKDLIATPIGSRQG